MPPGNIADLAMAVQAAKGTASLVSSHRVYLTGGDQIAAVPNVADVEETTSSRLRNAAFLASVQVEGAPQIAVRPKWIGLGLWGAMGAKAVAGVADPWAHTFTLASVQPYLTFWAMQANLLFERFADCKITSLNLQSDSNGILQATMGVLGLTPASKTAPETTAAVEGITAADTPFTHMDGKGQFLVETVPVAAIRSARIRFGTGVETAPGDAVTPQDVVEGMQVVEYETEQTVQNFAEWNRFHYGTTTPADNAVHTPNVIELAGSGLDWKWAKRDTAGAVATPERSLQFTATRVQIASVSRAAFNTDGTPLTRTVTYKIYQPASGSGLTAILKNGVAAYAAS